MNTSSLQELQNAFFQRSPLAQSLIKLFDSLPQITFFAKDRESRFIRVNQRFLQNHRLLTEFDAIGKTDRDLHPPLMAKAYMDEDHRVMVSGKTLAGQIWLVIHQRPIWYAVTKTPLFATDNTVIGIAGAMYPIERKAELAGFLQEIFPAARYMEKHFAESISMSDMAALAGLSSTHFNRRFRQLLRMTPMHYLRSVRIQTAQRLLTTSSKSLSVIAIDVGYTDQSHLTKRFREVTGMTPSAYKKRFVSPTSGIM